jgi:hypothetical protein
MMASPWSGLHRDPQAHVPAFFTGPIRVTLLLKMRTMKKSVRRPADVAGFDAFDFSHALGGIDDQLVNGKHRVLLCASKKRKAASIVFPRIPHRSKRVHV